MNLYRTLRTTASGMGAWGRRLACRSRIHSSIVLDSGRIAVLALLTSVAVCLAQDDSPLAKPTPEESRKAATGMLFMMLGGLVVVVLLLRWVSRKQPPPPKPTDDSPFAKAEDYFGKQGK